MTVVIDNRHESFPTIGAAMPLTLMASDLKPIKEQGCNFIRGSHYPQRRSFLEMCDRMGMLVWEATLGWGILAFNRVADPQDRISDQDIAYMVETEKIPEHLAFQGDDPAYGPYKVLLRRTSEMVRLTLFEGGHNLLPCPAFGFLNEQVRGAEPVWYSGYIYNEKVKELTK